VEFLHLVDRVAHMPEGVVRREKRLTSPSPIGQHGI
jgi:hypothetical protein